MSIKAIIFDKDGVLVDSEELKATAWQETLGLYGIGDGFDWYLSNLGPSSNFLAIKAIDTFRLRAKPTTISYDWNKNYSKIKHQVKPITQNLRILEKLANTYSFSIGVASSMDSATIVAEMLRFEVLDHIQAYASGEEVLNNKPAPDVYLTALERLKMKPSECIAIEDSPTGIQAAKSAHIFCIGYKNPLYSLDLSKADLIIDDLSEIPFADLNLHLKQV